MTIFGIGPVELLIIVVIALVFVGPERLPELLYQLGQGINKAKKLVLDLRDQAKNELGDDYESFEDMTRQIRELNPRRQIQELSRSLLEDLSPVTKIELPPAPMVPQPSAPDIAALAQNALAADVLEVPLAQSFDDDSALLTALLNTNLQEREAHG